MIKKRKLKTNLKTRKETQLVKNRNYHLQQILKTRKKINNRRGQD